jgi:hypothetical protein
MKTYKILSAIIFKAISFQLKGDDRFWISFGVGVSDIEIESWQPYPSFPLSFNYSTGSKLFRFRHYYNSLTIPLSEQTESVRDIGFLYGYSKEFSRGTVSLSGGISLVAGYFYSYEYEDGTGYTSDRENFSTVGFPFEAQLDWSAFRRFGIGLSIYGDINNEMSFYGISFNFNIGKLR